VTWRQLAKDILEGMRPEDLDKEVFFVEPYDIAAAHNPKALHYTPIPVYADAESAGDAQHADRRR
jgi:hypothetical protein